MSLEYAILGFLNYKPLTGYELKKIFDTSVKHFWSADQSQIYRTLDRLTDQGYAVVEVVEQVDRPNRKVYSITESGRQELLKWLSGPFPMESPRSGELVQVFFSGQLSDEEVIAKMEQAAAYMRSILGAYNQVPSQVGEYMDMVNSPRETFFWMLTLELGLKTFQVQLEWVESIIERVRNHQMDPSFTHTGFPGQNSMPD